MNRLLIVMFLAMLLCFADHAFGKDPVVNEPRLNGTQLVSDPSTWDIYRLGLVQVFQGYAIYHDELENGFQPFVAVEVKSLETVQRGSLLLQLANYSKGGVGCLKFLGEGKAEDKDGFPTKVVKYTAVKCEVSE